jgi:iron complex transport system permease protein
MRGGPVSALLDIRVAAISLLVGLACLGVTIIAVSGGDYPVSALESLAALFGSGDPFVQTVVQEWRLPRALVAILFGAGLGVSGAIFQSLIRNPLGSPDVIGFDGGAYFGAIVVIVLLHGTGGAVGVGAIVGGIATVLAVYFLAWKRGITGFRLVIVGICVGATIGALSAYVVAQAAREDRAVAMAAGWWGAGSLVSTDWGTVRAAIAWMAPTVALIAVLSRGRAMLELGDDAAAARGVPVERTRLALMLLAVCLSAMVVTLAGPIVFVALVAPRLGHLLARSPGVALAPAAAMGALLLATSDLIARRGLGVEVPVGLVTVVIGGLYLILLLARQARGRPL